MRHPTARPTVRWAAGLAVALALSATATGSAPIQQVKHEFSITAFRYGYRVTGSSKPEIRVAMGDLVKITFTAEDIPHSFTIDDYRIMRRAEPGGKPATIEFRADRKGTFDFYCNLTNDERCRKETRGTLHVK